MARTGRELGGRTQLSDDVASHIRDLIMSGQVRAGDYLRIEHLADQFGTSVTPVREALLALRGEGFVILQPRRGFVVSAMTRQDIIDLYQVQSYLAGELAARACSRLDAEALDLLEDTQTRLEAAHESGESEELEQLNHRFHRTINLAAESPKLVWFLATATKYAPRMFFAEISGWTHASAEDHRTILKAFRAGDSEAARVAMSEHVANAGELLVKHLETQGIWDGTD